MLGDSLQQGAVWTRLNEFKPGCSQVLVKPRLCDRAGIFLRVDQCVP